MSNIMFPKPEKKTKEPYKGLKTNKPLQAKTRLQSNTKLKGKRYKTKNSPVKENEPCELNLSRCTGKAIEKHELKAGHSFRDSCIKHGFNVATCRNCHEDWELVLDDEQRLPIRQAKQREVMKENNWDKQDFINHIGINYL